MSEFDDLRAALVRLEDKIDAVLKYAETRLGGLADEVELLRRQVGRTETAGGLDLRAEAKDSGIDLDRRPVADPAYTPTLEEALRHLDAFVDGMEEIAPVEKED
jgi:hypothetical protein